MALEHLEGGTGRLLPGVELADRAAPEAGAAAAEKGDVLFGKLRPYLAKGWLVDRPVFASTELMCLRPQPGVDSRWLSYLCNSRALVDWAVATSDGTKMPRTSWEKLAEYRLGAPAPDWQGVIADYLDAETARIDALIVKKRRMIDLIAERRMAVMTDGVAGRLTCGSPGLKVKLSLVACLGSGHTPSREHPEWWQDCTIPWVTTGEVAQMRSDRLEYITQTREKISELGVANSSAEVQPAGTVVLCRTASAGYSAIMGTDMATSQDFATWTCGPRLRPRFLLLCLRAMRQDLLGRLALGSTHQTIYMPDIEALGVPLPELCEQDAIIDAVWTRLRAVDRAVDNLGRQLDLLAERRLALITAAVTGELPIPGAAGEMTAPP